MTPYDAAPVQAPRAQPLIDGLAGCIGKRQIGSHTRWQGPAQQGLHQRRQPPAAYAHNAHGPAPRRSGYGGNRLGMDTEHHADIVLLYRAAAGPKDTGRSATLWLAKK